MKSLKHVVQTDLESNDLDAIVTRAKNDKKTISRLVRLAYDKDTLVGWRAIKAVGLAARELVKTDPEFLRETCRKLLWSLSDESGGIGWSAPELLGEIVCADVKRFREFIPLIVEVYGVEEDVFRPGVVYALGRIAEAAPELVTVYQKVIIAALVDNNPLTNIYALELVDRIWDNAAQSNTWSTEYRERVKSAIKNLTSNKSEAWLYGEDSFINVSIGEKADEVLEKL